MEIILLAAAEVDLQAAYQRHENIQSARGDEFIHRVDLALSMLIHHPLLGPRYHLNYRRLLTQNFPYGIFYVPEPTRLIVHAVLDLRMHPSRIKQKLSPDLEE